MKEGYSDCENDLANMNLEDFLASMRGISNESYRLLKEDRYIAFLMSSRQISKLRSIDLTFEVYSIFGEKFDLAERIVLVGNIHNKQTEDYGLLRWRARNYSFLLRGFRDLVVMKKPSNVYGDMENKVG